MFIIFLFYFSYHMGMKWYHTVIFTCIFLRIHDSKHFFMCLLATYTLLDDM